MEDLVAGGIGGISDRAGEVTTGTLDDGSVGAIGADEPTPPLGPVGGAAVAPSGVTAASGAPPTSAAEHPDTARTAPRTAAAKAAGSLRIESPLKHAGHGGCRRCHAVIVRDHCDAPERFSVANLIRRSDGCRSLRVAAGS
jgi:hypothetical protein